MKSYSTCCGVHNFSRTTRNSLKFLIATSIISLLSLSSFAETQTALNQKNIRGQYLVKSRDVYMVAHITLKKHKSVLAFHDLELDEDVVCEGTYTFAEDTLILKTEFDQCANSKISHTVYLEGKTLESLSEETEVMIALDINGESAPAIPFTLHKIK